MNTILRKISVLLCLMMLLGSLGMAAPAALAASGDALFDNSVFLGDSITVGLMDYVTAEREKGVSMLSNATFLARESYSVKGALNDDSYELHPWYGGKKQQPQKAIAGMNVDKVFILLGINDIGEDMDTIIANYTTLIRRIQNACPQVTIYVQSVFPMCASGEKTSLNNALIDTFNGKLEKLCSSLGITYIDICDNFKNSSGKLVNTYSSDGYVHLSNDGYKVWVDALRNYSASRTMTANVFNVTTCLNLRQTPSTSATRVGTIYNGTQVVVLETFVEDYTWHKISYNGKEAYVHRDYLKFPDSVSNPVEGTIVKVNEFVNARAEPNTNCDIPCTISRGAKVQVLRNFSTDNWYLVYYNQQYLYVRKDFISF